MQQTNTKQKASHKENLGRTTQKNNIDNTRWETQLFMHYTQTCGCNSDISCTLPSIWNRDYV